MYSTLSAAENIIWENPCPGYPKYRAGVRKLYVRANWCSAAEKSDNARRLGRMATVLQV